MNKVGMRIGQSLDLVASGSIKETCMMCDKPATWIRSTQFAGEHPYCEEHAKQEEGFGINDSYEYWYRPKDE
jgi:hypothetical protein